MKLIATAALVTASIALVGCESNSKGDIFANDVKLSGPRYEIKPDPYWQVTAMRDFSELCHSGSDACKAWRTLAYECELGMQEMDKGNFDNPYRGSCSEAEALRERVTGISLSTAPGAYSF